MTADMTVKSVSSSLRPPAYAISKDGKPYRSFRLVIVKDKRWAADGAIQHAATNKSKKEGVHTSHLGPLRAAQKIFDAWCRHNSVQVIKPTQFTIQETTRAKASKLFVYEGFREKLETPREIVVTNKATNTQHTIQYAYRSKICAYREGGKGKGAAATTKTSAAASKKAVGKKAIAAKKKGASATKAAATAAATITSKKAPAKAKVIKPAKKLIAKNKKVTAATAAKGETKGKTAKKSKPAAKATAPAITVSLS